MPKNTETTNVDEAVADAKRKLDEAKTRLSEARTLLSNARTERDESIDNAEKAYSEAYRAGFAHQQSELTSIDEAYQTMRQEIVSRWSVESATLSEARDVAVAAANEAYDDTTEAAQRVFGGGNV